MNHARSRGYSDTSDKDLVTRYLADKCGLTALELPVMAGGKTPDFEILDGNQRIFVAELKTLNECQPSVETGWTIERDADGVQLSSRPDNAPARVARKIADAHPQLQQYPHPWAVILLNRDHQVDVRDLLEAFSGESIYKGPDSIRVVNIASMRVALGETLRIRYEVDLYLWIDLVHESHLGVRWSSPLGEALARQYFKSAAGVD